MNPGNASLLALFCGLVLAGPASAGPTDDVLQIYGELTGKTILRGPNLPELSDSLKSHLPAEQKLAVATIQSELAKLAIEVVPDGEQFVRVLPPGWSNRTLVKKLARLKAPPRKGAAKPEVGAIGMRGADINQVLPIYADIRKRTVLRPITLPGAPITLVTQHPLTIDEVVYALNTVLLLSGIETIDDGDKFVQVVPIETALPIQTRAPVPQPGATLINPSEVPVLHLNPIGRNRLDLPKSGTVSTLGAYYAKLTARELVPTEVIDRIPIQFEAKTPLTKQELLYAMETTLALNGLEIVPVDEKSIRVGRIKPGKRT